MKVAGRREKGRSNQNVFMSFAASGSMNEATTSFLFFLPGFDDDTVLFQQHEPAAGKISHYV